MQDEEPMRRHEPGTPISAPLPPLHQPPDLSGLVLLAGFLHSDERRPPETLPSIATPIEPPPRPNRLRRHFSLAQREILDRYYAEKPFIHHYDSTQLEKLQTETGLTDRQISAYFKNRRKKTLPVNREPTTIPDATCAEPTNLDTVNDERRPKKRKRLTPAQNEVLDRHFAQRPFFGQYGRTERTELQRET